MSKQRALGRGLDALLEASRRGAVRFDEEAPGNAGIARLRVDALRPGRYQPRQHVSEAGLAELADSIREQGVLQPLVVRAVAPGPEEPEARAYEIVAGERRWRAAIIAGLSTVPVLVRELNDQSALAVALIENLQREDLNPIDQARSMCRLTEEFALTHEEVARAIGRSRASVSNFLRLLELDDEVKELLAHGRIDMGHARALLPLDSERQVAMARKAESRRLSVRQVESAVKSLLKAPTDAASAQHRVDLQTRWLQQQIERELGTRFAIRTGKDGNYALQVEFADLAQLQDALQRIQELVGQIRDAAGPRARDTE